MSSSLPPDGSGDRPAPFIWGWRDEGDAAASIQVSGELDPAASRQLAGVLHEALGSAQMLPLDVREVSFGDSSGLRAILDAAAETRAEGGRPERLGTALGR